MVQRLTYRRRLSYNTRSNRVKIIKTPGGDLRYLHEGKPGKAPKCGDCELRLPGIPALRPVQYSRLSKTKKTVRRAYGGNLCVNCVRQRIIRAFLIEEKKIVKKLVKSQTPQKK